MEQLSKEQVATSLLPDITSQNWAQLLEAAKSIKITKETIKVNYVDFMKLRDLYLFLKDKKDAEDKIEKDRLKARKEGYDTYMKPIEEILDAAEPEFIKYNAEIKKEEREVIAALNKRNEVRTFLLDFVRRTTQSIAISPDVTDLVRIQKSIGTEKSRTGVYGDFQDKMKDVCDKLLQLIESRKEIMKSNDKLAKSYEKAKVSDLALATELKAQMEYNDRLVAQNINELADNAIKEIVDINIVSTEMESAAILPRTHRWAWRISDIELLYKKSPEMVVKEPNTKAINAFMKTKTDEDLLDPNEDNHFNGLVLYRKPFFVAP